MPATAGLRDSLALPANKAEPFTDENGPFTAGTGTHMLAFLPPWRSCRADGKSATVRPRRWWDRRRTADRTGGKSFTRTQPAPVDREDYFEGLVFSHVAIATSLPAKQQRRRPALLK